MMSILGGIVTLNIKYKLRDPCKKCLVRPACSSHCQDYLKHLYFTEMYEELYLRIIKGPISGIIFIIDCIFDTVVFLILSISILLITSGIFIGLMILCVYVYQLFERMIL